MMAYTDRAMTIKSVKPTKVELRDGGVHVEWNDGHVSDYPAKHLRVNCACAECIEEWTRRKLLDPASVAADIRAEDYMMIGKYAVQFLWSDGHFTGIYPFDHLRRLCQCAACKAERERARAAAD
ncbi:MAG: DUF971 domain-containing protein [SAR202 cluster bacterium]|nr:DUF971 domain-containing protein [SAR202 cluster bacterium]